MAAVATARDVEEVVQKLQSDRARVRDEGVKLLGTWLQGDRAASFCRLLGRNTVRFKPGHGNLTGATTWPLLVLALLNCVKEDISGKKRGATKSAAARMFRVAVQCAEDVKLSGHSLHLLSVAKQLFVHIWEVIKDGPSLQLEYSIILRQLLNVKEYRYQMKPRTYSNFVSLYMKKVASAFDAKFSNQASSKDESFRCTLTLHVLLENPPSDYPDIMREEVLNGFSAIFLHIREEGKLTRKLMECINTFLLKDGPNLGYKSVKIHNAVQEFIFRCWMTTHDQALKSLFITYVKVQLKIARNIPEILEKLIDVIIKELDKNVNTGPGLLWCEAPRDEKAVSLRCFQEEWMDLSATVFYLACKCTTKTANREKRMKKEHIMNLIVDGLFRGSLFWSGSVCFLIHKYGYHLEKSLLISWFEASCKALRSILIHANAIRFQDSLLWLLRTFKEFSTVLMLDTRDKVQFCLTKGEMSIVEDCWQAIWNSLVHAFPLLSSIDLVADSALILLGGMIMRDQVHTSFLSEDTWNLQIFKKFPSPSALYFVACYFSRIGFQGDLSNSIFVRKTLLRSTLELIHSKEFSLLNEQNVVIIPEAIFSLCAGFSSPVINSSDILQLFGHCKIHSKMSLEDDNWVLKDELPYSVEALSEITLDTCTKVMSHKCHLIHLPGTIQQPMLLELMEFMKGFVASNEQFEKVDLNNLVLVCSLLCNLIHCALLSRTMEEKSSLLQETVDYVTNILKHIVSFVVKKNDELSHGLTNISSALDTMGSAFSSIKSLLSSPIFNLSRVDNGVCSVVIKSITELLDELLVAISQLFCQISSLVSNFDAESTGKMLPTSSINLEDLNPVLDCKSSVADMDLDVMDSSEVDSVTASASGSMGSFLRPLEWKLDLVCIISTFFSVSSLHTWEILYSLVDKEGDVKVRQAILLNLCRNISASSKTVSLVVHFIVDMRDRGASSLLGPAECLTHIHALLKALIAIHGGQNADGKQPGREVFFSENQDILFDLLNRATDISSVDWFSRIKFIDCVSSFVCLFPDVAQDLIGCLLDMLHDADYRVRLYLARQIVVLFQTWEGHNELFNDVCSSIGAKMVKFSNISPVTAREVLAVGPQSVLVIETALITLAHLAVHSEDVEVECLFMISAAAAIEPSQRELAFALFDSISRRLGYASRSKYLDQVMGPILFRWVACEMNLISLVEVQEMFGYGSAEPNNFVEHCSSWLLPFLILRGDGADMNWISKILSQPLSIIIKRYFVPIFGMCIAVRCGTGPEKDLAETVLCESVLQLGEISELERDDLIKKHMVAIVAFLLSVSSSAHGPQIPYFSKKNVALSVRMVVDGFVDTMDDNLADTVVSDKVNIFRADRVFKFLLSIHQQVADASHSRHMGHRLCAIEVLIDVLGHRVVLESTCFYIISIVGNYIQQKPLQGQCCNILSKLLAAFDGNTSAETLQVLGRQLQVVVPKLIFSCLINEKEERSGTEDSSRVLSLLHQLTVEIDPLLYDYIRELEPLPDLDCLKDVQEFHASLSASHSSRNQFLKFVNKAPYLPPELFLLSLRAYHKKLFLGEIIRRSDLSAADTNMVSCWHSDPDVISAVWALVDICSSSSVANEASWVLADFISRAGISDAHQVIFRLPTTTENYSLQLHTGSASKEDKLSTNYGISDDVLVGLLKLLKTYLSDESVEIIDAASQTLRGILSTARGLNALQFLDSPDRSLLMVHSRGVNIQIVEQTISQMEQCAGVSLDDADVWDTDGRTCKQWLCTLVSSLICHCEDTILRLCRSIVFVKVKAAELLLSSTLVNIAGNVDSNTAICKLISTKVEKIIFSDSNHSLKSIHLFLDALNVIRSFYVAEKARTFPSNTLKDGRSARSKSRSPVTTPSSSWKKVYWLSVDYLVAARAASRCSCDFAILMYVELWCEEQFNRLVLGPPEFSNEELLPPHVDLLVAAFTRINEPDSIYGLTLSNEIASQLIRYEHEGDWSSALEYYDLLVRSMPKEHLGTLTGSVLTGPSTVSSRAEDTMLNWKMHKGLMRSLQKTGCSHVLDVYCEGLSHQKGCLQQDAEFIDIQYEAAWRAGNWDFSFFVPYSSWSSTRSRSSCLFNENLHSCLRALQNGDSEEFHAKLCQTKMDLVLALSNTSKESTKYIHSTILKLQILDHATMVWDLRWNLNPNQTSKSPVTKEFSHISTVPKGIQLELLDKEWNLIMFQAERNLDLFEPFLAFRRALLKILGCEEHLVKHLFQSASALRKGLRFSLAAAALYELKELCFHRDESTMTNTYLLARLEDAKLLRAQGQHDMAISLGKYILQKLSDKKNLSDVYRLVGKWLAETRSSNSRTIIEDYLRPSIDLSEFEKSTDKRYMSRQCRTHFHLAHYTYSLFRSYEERLSSNEWQAALRLRKYKTRELEILIKRLRSSSKGVKTDYSVKIQELQKQLALDREEAEKIQDDHDNFLNLALQGYQRSIVVGGKYDLQVVFRLVSLWFSLFSRDQVVKAMLKTTKEVQTYKFIPLVYQIASRLGSTKDAQGSFNFQLLALANGDRVKDKQRSRSSFVVDMEKKLAAENLLKELSSCHGPLICQMKQMVEIYIKLAELETKKEDTNKKIPLPREARSIGQLELVPVVTATVPIDPSCRYEEGSFPHFTGLADSIMIMNGINAPKVIECFGSDGNKYRQLAKSGNDDLRQDAVMEQFFSLVNTFLQNHRDTSKRRLKIRTYKVVPFTPSAGVVEWVNGTVPLGDYLIGSTRSGGAHGRYGIGDWTYLQCREYLMSEKDKRRAFLKICSNFRPVMHHFFLERFLLPADWFQSRLAYTRSVAASSMVGYIVGLGDRHSMNILIDQDTAEVVHIDLGVAFEQGLMLKTPERVPFRLTRDIIDGMGVTGVEGVFRRCCEKTLCVMRANKEALLTIIEVFVHDPLYKWALSPLKALQRQKETVDTDSCLDDSQEPYDGNKDAARAILRVKQKLDGYEDGEMRSVQGQVQQLIQDAVDVDRLCQMFPGWGPWL
ncbi:serine/threonine-protein kinase ATM isoform X6 [Zea mays]|uniref:serine/threonine-protein kinase ATM isoform X6 n=1 Tax=Zea mays TaxID=4577 RepID=UPI0009AA266D|nr:serine/threonine-protein kinase ATM isoform X6 [Zea mays]|eukprot:XP_020405742.1 serine/threonine-protein kinase ATM isoform X6 [Zea mays]